MLKKILYALAALLVIIQFIKPARNQSAGPFPNDINTKFAMSDEVKTVMQTACYDCHSNNTEYPWYANIQPVAWWLQNHVNDGKKHLNFSEFTTYTEKRQRKKLQEIEESVTEGWMPLDSYTWIHKNAILTADQKAAIKKWTSESLAKLPAAEPENRSDQQKTESHD
ncbi:MAG: heme-binding domain-containing protein [Chitinophagaceae bacterium]